MSKPITARKNPADGATDELQPGRAVAAAAGEIRHQISGQDRAGPRPENAIENPGEGPGGEVAGGSVMSRERFRAGLLALGYNISTAHRLLGMGRSTIYRMSKGETEVPQVVMRLMDMYERHGIPPEHRR